MRARNASADIPVTPTSLILPRRPRSSAMREGAIPSAFASAAIVASFGDRNEEALALANDAGAFRTRFHLDFKRRDRLRLCHREFPLRVERTAAPQRRMLPS